ncbi:MAG: DUF459 domain-containing protein [Alphaproteobacteria bacterium]|nr:DUF459 domain-containing protein [Alphaproteobacteria bacterium]
MGKVAQRRAGFFLALWVLAWTGLGMASQAQASDEQDEAFERRIGVFGDSLADGLWVGLQRGLRAEPRAGDIIQLSEVSTGLTNYVYRDISEKTRDQLSREDYDTAVVLFGSNDIQGIRTDQGVYRFRSDAWEAVYRERIRDIVTQLQADGAEVYWVGLPVMRSNGYNANTIYLNALFREEVESLGAVFIDTRDVTGDENGEYAPYLPDSRGTPRLVRADDGIHFTLTGYTRMAAPVVSAIRENWDNPRRREREQVAETPAETRPAGWLDLLINGEAYVCQPVSVEGTPLASGTAPSASE